jgi:hypothetical protein
MLTMAGLACSRSGDNDIIYITATPLRDEQGNPIIPPTYTPNEPTKTPILPTPNPVRQMPQESGVYMVQPGDTRDGWAELYGVTIEAVPLNQLETPARSVGQRSTPVGRCSAQILN